MLLLTLPADLISRNPLPGWLVCMQGAAMAAAQRLRWLPPALFRIPH